MHASVAPLGLREIDFLTQLGESIRHRYRGLRVDLLLARADPGPSALLFFGCREFGELVDYEGDDTPFSRGESWHPTFGLVVTQRRQSSTRT